MLSENASSVSIAPVISILFPPQENSQNHMTIHRPILWITAAFCVGALAEKFFHPSSTFVMIGSLVFLLMSGLTFRLNRVRFVFLLLTFVGLGMMRMESLQRLPKDHINDAAKFYRRHPAEIEGIIVSDVETRSFFKGKKTVFTLAVKRIQAPWGWQRRSGKILVQIFRPTDLQYGQLIHLRGKLHKPFEFASKSRFSYRDYLARREIHLVLSIKKGEPIQVLATDAGNPITTNSFKIRRRLQRILTDNLPSQSAGIMDALLLGNRYDISKGLKNIFVQTGTAHILAISGFNVGIVASLLFIFLKIVLPHRKGQYCLTILLLIFYAFLTGGQAPVIRSTIMAGIFLFSFLIEREADPINSWGMAAFFILMMNPGNIFDVGFQLSFVSVFFILVLYTPIMQWFSKRWPQLEEHWIVHAIVQSTTVSFVASIGVMGLIAYYFNIVTPITLLANLVIIPLTSLNIVLGVGLLLTGLLCPFLSFAFAACLKVNINLMIFITYLFAQIPGAYFYLPNIPPLLVIAYYLCVAWGTYALLRHLRK